MGARLSVRFQTALNAENLVFADLPFDVNTVLQNHCIRSKTIIERCDGETVSLLDIVMQRGGGQLEDLLRAGFDISGLTLDQFIERYQCDSLRTVILLLEYGIYKPSINELFSSIHTIFKRSSDDDRYWFIHRILDVDPNHHIRGIPFCTPSNFEILFKSCVLYCGELALRAGLTLVRHHQNFFPPGFNPLSRFSDIENDDIDYVDMCIELKMDRSYLARDWFPINPKMVQTYLEIRDKYSNEFDTNNRTCKRLVLSCIELTNTWPTQLIALMDEGAFEKPIVGLSKFMHLQEACEAIVGKFLKPCDNESHLIQFDQMDEDCFRQYLEHGVLKIRIIYDDLIQQKNWTLIRVVFEFFDGTNNHFIVNEQKLYAILENATDFQEIKPILDVITNRSKLDIITYAMCFIGQEEVLDYLVTQRGVVIEQGSAALEVLFRKGYFELYRRYCNGDYSLSNFT